jgi:F-type H+-transporting ATPase subunit delta
MASDANQHRTADIGRQQVGSVYAKALLGATENAGVTDRVLTEFDGLIRHVLDRFPAMEATLASPRVSVKEKTNLLNRLFGSRLSELLLTFLKVTCAHGRLDCLREIFQEARRQLHEKRGLVEVQVTTAQPLGASLVETVSLELQTLLARDLLLRQATDPALIGGMVVRVGDTVYDASVATGLNRLRSEALEKTVEQMRSGAERFAAAP